MMAGSKREKNDGGDDVMDPLVNIRDHGAKKISAENHACNPQIAAGHIIGKIASVRHQGSAGHRRTKRSHNGNKPSENHRFPAILFIELVCAFQMALPENQGILAAIQRLTGFPANPIADLVAGNCAQRNQQHQFADMETPGSGENASRDQKGIAGEKKSYKKASLNENDHANQQRAAPLDQALNIEQKMSELARAIRS